MMSSEVALERCLWGLNMLSLSVVGLCACSLAFLSTISFGSMSQCPGDQCQMVSIFVWMFCFQNFWMCLISGMFFLALFLKLIAFIAYLESQKIFTFVFFWCLVSGGMIFARCCRVSCTAQSSA